MLLKTKLYANHLALNAKMVNFHGWEMPLNYGSQLNEHHAVRQDAGMFDVAHMTVVDILGAGGRQFLRKLLTNDIDQLGVKKRAMYSCMCNEHGGIIDDLIVYQRSSDNYRLVLNSATRQQVLEWIRARSEGFAVGLQERNELSMLAVQGPHAIAKVMQVVKPGQMDALATLGNFECVDVDNYFFARTGYTGEDGLEILLPQEEIVNLWEALLQANVQPCGLAARDTLRLEAGMHLYGQDMDESTTPLESGLEWVVSWQPTERDFIGMGALVSKKQHGVKQKLVGLILQDKGIMRAGLRVVIEDAEDGIITSGTYSPSLAQSIAFARVPMQTGNNVLVEIRGKLIPAKVVGLKFVKRGRFAKSIEDK